jgi:signal transduction histidine kinase/CheY-like chemotaxis protein
MKIPGDLRRQALLLAVGGTSVLLFASFLLIAQGEIRSFRRQLDARMRAEDQTVAAMIRQNYGMGDIIELRRTLDTLCRSLGYSAAELKNGAGEVMWTYDGVMPVPQSSASGRAAALFSFAVPKDYRDPASSLSASSMVRVDFDDGTPMGYFSRNCPLQSLLSDLALRLITVCALFVLLLVILNALMFSLVSRILNPLELLISRMEHETLRLGVRAERPNLSDIGFINRAFDGMMSGWQADHEKALSASKFAAIGQTAAMLAHDIRKPFSLTKSLLSALPSLRNDDAALENARGEVEKSIIQADSMIADVLDFSREVKIAAVPESLFAALEFSIKQAARQHPGGDVSLEYALRHSRMPLMDAPRISRALANIIDNAIDAVTMMSARQNGKISISSRDMRVGNADFAELSIADDGPAIAGSDLKNIFESFFTKGKSKGTGLGLASARKTLLLHGGDIRVENLPDAKGVVFIMHIPLSDKAENPVTLPGNIRDLQISQPAVPAMPVTEKLFIFACDDNALERKCIAMHIGAVVPAAVARIFPSAEELLAEMRTLRMSPDVRCVVFTDQNMVGMTGLELAAELRRLKVPCKIFMVSNEPESEFAPRALAAGADGYFEGPLDEQVLSNVFNSGWKTK